MIGVRENSAQDFTKQTISSLTSTYQNNINYQTYDQHSGQVLLPQVWGIVIIAEHTH